MKSSISCASSLEEREECNVTKNSLEAPLYYITFVHKDAEAKTRCLSGKCRHGHKLSVTFRNHSRARTIKLMFRHVTQTT